MSARPVPAHAPNCFGCGPENEAGLGLELTGEGERASGVITLQPRHEGAPGLAHGGTIASVLDDAAGRLMYLTGRPAVTRRLEVDYLARVGIGIPLEVSAAVSESGERGLVAISELAHRGRTLARARAEMSFVEADYWVEGGLPGGLQGPGGRAAHAERSGG